MILNHINNKMPIYKDCTFAEMLFVSVAAFISLSCVLSLLTRLLFGYAFIGLSIAILSIVFVVRGLLSRLQKIKYGKPYGYYQHLILKKAQQYALFKRVFRIGFLQRAGKWSIRRKL
jgi:conjugative transfer region protein (TIGR03750 family)